MSRLLLAAFASVAMAFTPGADPASSWLAYVRINLGNTQISNISMSWVCPEKPSGGSAPALPGFWYGIENSKGKFAPMTILLQPIMAIGYNVGPDDYTLFNGRYDWNGGSWWSSPKQCDVSPGQNVVSYTAYDSSSDAFELVIANADTGCTVSNSIPAQGQTFGNAVIVIEHQPSNCNQMPAGGGMTFDNIVVEVNGSPIQPSWSANKFQDVCDVTPVVQSPSQVEFTWESTSKSTST